MGLQATRRIKPLGMDGCSIDWRLRASRSLDWLLRWILLNTTPQTDCLMSVMSETLRVNKRASFGGLTTGSLANIIESVTRSYSSTLHTTQHFPRLISAAIWLWPWARRFVLKPEHCRKANSPSKYAANSDYPPGLPRVKTSISIHETVPWAVTFLQIEPNS